MDGTLKRQRSNHSLGGSTKRARWEADLSSPPSECSPSSLGSLISGAQSAHVSGGTFTIVGRDSTTTVHHHYAPATVDILEILNSIPLPNFRNIQLDTYAKATQGTCGWLITGDTFLFWVKNGKILWGIGIPGAGKTILASIVINYLEQLEEEAAGGSICVAYVYVRYSEPLAARDILESLVRQIIERHVDLVPAAETLYGKHKRERTRPSQQDLLRLLSRFTELGKTLFFVIDAVDEMPSEERAVTLGLLASLDARLFVTSRPLPLLQQCFPMAQMLEVTAHSSDIDLLIQDSLSRHPDLMVLLEDPNLGNHIKQKIRQKSGGMFLHVKLQLEALRHCISIQDAEETVEQFPADIKAIYTKTWERILAQGQKHAGLAKLVLLWILHASGEMTINQLRHAIATCPSTSHYDARRLVPEPLLISVCCGLVAMDKTSRHVRLMHHTTRDAILPLILELFPHPHAIPASVCISYLTRRGFQCSNFEDAERFNDALDEDPLLSYAYDAWAEHTSNCLGYEPVMSAVASFVLGCTKFPLETPGGEIDFLGPLHVAAFYNFKQLVPLAARLQPVNARTPTSGQPPLNLACRRGNHFCVEGLLALPGIDVNLRDSADGWSALMEASSEGHMKTMQILLKVPELDVNAATAGGWTALLLTSVGGRPERVKLLLGAPGININAANSEGFTALTEATIGGHRETVRAILEAPGVDVNASVPAKFVPSALIYASAMGYEEIVGMLIARPEVNVNARNARGLTSLGWASRRGHSAIVALLLGVSRLRVDIVDKDGYTALSYAVEEGHQEVVDLIVDLWIQRCTDVGGGS